MEKNEVLSLIKLARQKDVSAFQELYFRYKNSIRSQIAIRIYINSDIEDLEQELWKEVWKKIDTFNENIGSFYSFIKYWVDIIIKRYFDKLKKNGKIQGEIVKEDYKDSFEDCKKLLKLTFSINSPPHQLISFSLNKLLNYGPKFIVINLSEIEFEKLLGKILEEFKKESKIDEKFAEEAFLPLKNKMSKKVFEVLDKTSKKIYFKILEKIVGGTILLEYYGKDPEHNISDWSNKIKIKVYREWKKTNYPKIYKNPNEHLNGEK